MRPVNSGMPEEREYRRISDYGIIGDMHSCALIASDSSIDWCCLPDFDSPSIFAAILDKKIGGRFQIMPTLDFNSRHEYLKHTNILKTSFLSPQGKIEITDFMPCHLKYNQHITFGEIHRKITCTEGEETIKIHFDPRLDYARSETKITISKYGCIASDGERTVSLSTDIPLHLNNVVLGSISLSKGESQFLVLKNGEKETLSIEEYESEEKLKRTTEFWQNWIGEDHYKGLWKEEVHRSELVLKLLIYSPTGAIIAAPTTSLPERVGGSRNWDYRFSWLRDSAFALRALVRLGHRYDAEAFFRWLTKSGYDRDGAELKLMFGIKGEMELLEKELNHLEGYRQSKPVRIGNEAHEQFQLDVYGVVVDAIYLYRPHGEIMVQERWTLLKSLVDFVSRNWEKPDNSIWEVRGGRRHFVYSKLMCWVAMDRGVRVAREIGFEEDADRWKPIRDKIKAEILAKGWNPKKRAFVQYYGSNQVDASILMMPLVHFLPATDERFVSTVDRIREDLATDHLVHRYKGYDDGLEGREGAFALCSFWLVDALTLTGKLDEAKRLFEKLLKHGNSLGLFSEEIDEESGELLGNFPQSFTHMVLINSALKLDRALREPRERS